MTRLTNSPTMVALVQSAMMLPLMLASVPAGAIADMHDRRKVAMGGLLISIAAAGALTLLSMAGLATPWLILGFCFLIGVGVAIYSPAWQASINEQVSPHVLPAAVALGTISYNVARSFGPAIGGVVVLALGAQAAFAMNAVFYLPLLLAFWLWRRQVAPPRLPPEGLGRAIVSGTRYVFHSPLLKRVLIRVFLFGFVSATATALAPLIAKDLLGGDAATYGILLGASGAGAVLGALYVGYFRAQWGTEWASRVFMVVAALGVITVGLSRNMIVSCMAMFAIGATNILAIALYNVAVQLSAPRWVIGRAVSLFGSALTGGIAIGAWMWGEVAQVTSLEFAIIASGVVLLLLPIVSFFLPIGAESTESVKPVSIPSQPDVALPITMRSGPVVVEIDYSVAENNAREFYNAALQLRPLRLRNGGYSWAIERDIAEPTLWTERYHCPTWGDYLRVRDRYTAADQAEQIKVDEFLMPGTHKRVRRRLERPTGSVRWQDDTPDNQHTDTAFNAP